ncbi:hypothetical protein Mgra_00005186 [Meloidogyne graminicola]|uniref:Uncharacterized protein n=1 Tax=Meloidogyne graminicola TaxID=189291 RepID=A0A8S9ZQN6_9BILA|nr:hypothetical protein Mgra_00005186 [Meloidogyne graminicola]
MPVVVYQVLDSVIMFYKHYRLGQVVNQTFIVFRLVFVVNVDLEFLNQTLRVVLMINSASQDTNVKNATDFVVHVVLKEECHLELATKENALKHFFVILEIFAVKKIN